MATAAFIALLIGIFAAAAYVATRPSEPTIDIDPDWDGEQALFDLLDRRNVIDRGREPLD